jgi:exonuclease VII small subunit
MKQQVTQSQQILRLHRLRIQEAEKAYRQAQRLLAEAKQALEQREQQISELREQHSQVFSYLRLGNNHSQTTLLQQAHQRREWLEFDLEKENFYLEMDEQDVKDAQEKCDDAKKHWLAAQAKIDKAERMVTHSNRHWLRHLDVLQEMDAEEAFSGGQK